jgi:hypothetical protein
LNESGFFAIPQAGVDQMQAFRMFFVVAPAAMLLTAPALAQKGGTPLVPHRATYELSLLKATGSKAPTAASGRIAFDFSGSACDGYTQEFRQVTEIQPPEGETRVSDMRSTTFEDAEGRKFRFRMTTRGGRGGGEEEVDGSAGLSRDGALSVELKRPRRAKLDLAQGVLFPTEHLRRVIVAAKAGGRIFETKVYDGSDNGDRVYDTLAVIGRPPAGPAQEKAAQAAALKGMTRWPVSISYFDSAKKDAPPNYVLSFDLYENGVARALRLDYGDFVLAGEMTELDVRPATECKR